MPQKEVIEAKPFLKAWYIDTYRRMDWHLPSHPWTDRVLEIGSGGHNLIREVIPECVTSDIISGNDLVMSATHIQAGDGTLDAILAVNVYHHLEYPDLFISEAGRCLRLGGRLILVEPSKTLWARLVYLFHHEKESQFALWDETRSSRPKWYYLYGLSLVNKETFCPFSYILGGGVKRKWSAPMWMYRPVRWLDKVFRKQGIFALYVFERAA